jgi:hypothetical protein
MFHDLCRIPPVAGSSTNRETPFREEIGFEALRTDGVVLFFQIPLKNRCGIFGSGTPERKCRNILFLLRISENQ